MLEKNDPKNLSFTFLVGNDCGHPGQLIAAS